jgi:hypothetical protein
MTTTSPGPQTRCSVSRRKLHLALEHPEAFVSDPEYAPHAARQSGSDSRFQLIDDTDLAGTIPYLPKPFSF